MRLEITIYKDTGKWYTDCIAEHQEDIPLWKDDFLIFIAENMPTSSVDGYVVVRDMPDGCNEQSSHNVLFKCSEILKYKGVTAERRGDMEGVK